MSNDYVDYLPIVNKKTVKQEAETLLEGFEKEKIQRAWKLVMAESELDKLVENVFSGTLKKSRTKIERDKK